MDMKQLPTYSSLSCFLFLVCTLLFTGWHAAVVASEISPCSRGYDDIFVLVETGKETALLLQIKQDASNGNTEAQLCLAELYLFGLGEGDDEAKAWNLFQQAVRAGNAIAMNRLGAMYEQGIHVDQNYTEALKWHLKSAKLGYATAQSDVGIFYEDGLAGDRDVEKALFWYKKAALQEEPFAVEALQRLGKSFFNHPRGFFLLEDSGFISSAAFAIAVQDDGRIVIAGNGDNGENSDIIILRLDADGSLDRTFGESGIVTHDGGRDDLCYALALQADGKIIVAGSTNTGCDLDVTVHRYLSTGLADKQFGRNGIVNLDISGSSLDHGLDLLVEKSGRIIVSGWTEGKGDKDLFIQALSPSGMRDTSFGMDGLFLYDQGDDELGMALKKHIDGRILVAGYRLIEDSFRPLFFAVSKDGKIDTSFRREGNVTSDFSKDGQIFDIEVAKDASILLVGKRLVSRSSVPLLIAYDWNGSPLDSNKDVVSNSETEFFPGFLSSITPFKKNTFIVAGGLKREQGLKMFISKAYLSETKPYLQMNPSTIIATDHFEEFKSMVTALSVLTNGDILVCGWSKGKDGVTRLFVLKLLM